MGGMIQVSRIASAIPTTPPVNVSTSASSRNCTRICRGRAPSALLQADLARALGDRYQHDVHHAHPANRQRDRLPMMPSTTCSPSGKAAIISPLSTESQTGAALSSRGSEVVAARNDLADRSHGFQVQFGRLRLDDEHVRIAHLFQVAVYLEGNEAVFIVRTLVHRVLNLVPQGADDLEGPVHRSTRSDPRPVRPERPSSAALYPRITTSPVIEKISF